MNRVIVGIHSIIKTFVLSVLVIAQVHFSYAQTASILAPAQTTFFDQNGNPLTSGTVEFFVPGQTTHKTTWQDSGETTPNQNPLTLDAAGRALIWGDGAYRQVVKDSNHNLIWDAVTSSPGAGSSGGTTTIGDSNSVGAVVPWSGFTLPAQYLYAAGQAISRTTYPLLYSLITQNETVTCNGGSPTLTAMADTSQLNVGAVVESICVSSGATIISKTATSVTLSINATLSISTNAIFYPYGNGDGLTTFNLPDYRGVVLPGRNNMNGVASSNLTTPFYTDPNALYGAGGNQSGTLVTTNLPPYTPAGSVGTNITQAGGVGQGVQPGTSGPVNIGGSGSGGTVEPLSASSSFTGTAQGGTSNPFSLIQPSKTVNYIIKVSPNPAVSTVVCANLQDAGTACVANTGTSGHAVPFLDGGNTFSGTNTFTNGITINNLAASLVGNKTSTAGPDVDFTIQGLTAKTVPDANNDLLLLWDNATNTFKKVTPGQVGSSGASGVTSLDAVTGNITAQTGSLKVIGTQLSSNVLSSRAFAITQNLSAFNSIQTQGYAAAGDGGGATFKNVGSARFTDTYILGLPTITTAGSGLTNGTYLGVALGNGTGLGCAGSAVVSGGVLASVSIAVPCPGYSIGDVLTISTSSIGGTGVAPTLTVTAISTPQASFIDSAGTHWQFMTDQAGRPNVLQFGCKGDWNGSDGSATNNSSCIWSATAWSMFPVGTSIAQVNGNELFFPRGSYMTCGQWNSTIYDIPIPQGVHFTGAGIGATTLMECAADASGAHYIELCDSNAQSGEFGCSVEKMLLNLQQVSASTSGVAAIYSNSGQQFPLGSHLSIQAGNARGCIKYEIGKGGAANAIFYNIDCIFSGANTSNPGVSVNSSSTQFVLRDSVIENGGAGSRAIDNLAGRLIVDGLDIETFATGLNQNNATGGNVSVYRNVQQNSNSCTQAILLQAANAPGNILFENVATTCPTTITNGQSGGSNFTGNIRGPTMCVSGACAAAIP